LIFSRGEGKKYFRFSKTGKLINCIDGLRDFMLCKYLFFECKEDSTQDEEETNKIVPAERFFEVKHSEDSKYDEGNYFLSDF